MGAFSSTNAALTYRLPIAAKGLTVMKSRRGTGLRLARAVALCGLVAWIGHVSYANLAGIATFGGRYVVGVVANGSETSTNQVSCGQPSW